MFASATWFAVLEGDHSEDQNFAETIYRSEKKAMTHLRKSRAKWVRIDKWAGRIEDGAYEGDYVDTIAEEHHPGEAL